MDKVGSLFIELCGGPMDGDSIVLGANGSVGIPQQLSYIGAHKKQAGWMVYEAENVFEALWPVEDQHKKYHFIGWYNLARSKRLDS